MAKQKSTISRRAALSAGLAAAAMATAECPALAAAPDAELLRLGAIFDELKRQHDEASIRWQPYEDFVDAEFAKLRDGKPHENLEYEAIWARGLAEIPTAKPHPDDVISALDAPSRAIMALPATTLAGLAVKAKVAKFGCEHMYEGNFDDRDWDHKTATQLIDAVLAMGGKAHG